MALTPQKISSVKLLTDAVAPGAGDAHAPWAARRTFQAVGSTSSGAGAADVRIEVSNDGVNYIEAGAITLTLSTSASSDGFASDAAWRYVRARVDSISGTGAAVTVWMGA